MGASGVDFRLHLNTRPFVDAIRTLIEASEDPEAIRLYDLFYTHTRDCGSCYMADARIPTQWSRRWVSRTYRAINKTGTVCGYGYYLQMANLRTATR
jgi:hypothetical protein